MNASVREQISDITLAAAVDFSALAVEPMIVVATVAIVAPGIVDGPATLVELVIAVGSVIVF